MTRFTAFQSICLTTALLASSPATAAADKACTPDGAGRLRMAIAGHFDTLIDWGNKDTLCDGSPRPDGRALRIMFNQPEAGLLIVIGITGVERGQAALGLPANLTIVREGRAEFFSTLGADTCLVDVTENRSLGGARETYRVTGSGRCLAPIEAVASSAEIRVASFEFTGLAHWTEEETAPLP